MSELRDNRIKKLHTRLESMYELVGAIDGSANKVSKQSQQLVEQLNSVTFTPAFLKAYGDVNCKIMKYIGVLEQINCMLEILLIDDDDETDSDGKSNYTTAVYRSNSVSDVTPSESQIDSVKGSKQEAKTLEKQKTGLPLVSQSTSSNKVLVEESNSTRLSLQMNRNSSSTPVATNNFQPPPNSGDINRPPGPCMSQPYPLQPPFHANNLPAVPNMGFQQTSMYSQSFRNVPMNQIAHMSYSVWKPPHYNQPYPQAVDQKAYVPPVHPYTVRPPFPVNHPNAYNQQYNVMNYPQNQTTVTHRNINTPITHVYPVPAIKDKDACIPYSVKPSEKPEEKVENKKIEFEGNQSSNDNGSSIEILEIKTKSFQISEMNIPSQSVSDLTSPVIDVGKQSPSKVSNCDADEILQEEETIEESSASALLSKPEQMNKILDPLTKPFTPSNDKDDVHKDVLSIKTAIESKSFKKLDISFDPGVVHSVLIDYVGSVREFYVQPAQKLAQFKCLRDKINMYFGEHQNLSQKYHNDFLSPVEKKTLAAALLDRYAFAFQEDECEWFRVEILDWRINFNCDTVKVRFIDYGDSTIISIIHLQPLPDSFYSYPCFAIKCHLQGVQATEQVDEENKDAVHWFQTLSKNVDVQANMPYIHICEPDEFSPDDSLPVSVFLHDDLNLSEVLVEKGLVEVIPGKHADKHKDRKNSKVTAARMQQKLVPVIGRQYKIEITTFCAVNRFYCLITDECTKAHLEDFQSLLQEISNYADHMKRLFIPPEVNDIVLGKYSSDQKWYRAKVIKADVEDDQFTLFFVDYGNTEVVPLDMMREMEVKFLNLPFQAIECVIQEIEQLDVYDKNGALKYLGSIIEQGFAFITIINIICESSLTNNMLLNVKLLDCDYFDVGAMLVASKYAKSRRNQ